MGRVSQARVGRRTFYGEEQQVQRPRGKELNGISVILAKFLGVTGMQNARRGNGMDDVQRMNQGDTHGLSVLRDFLKGKVTGTDLRLRRVTLA